MTLILNYLGRDNWDYPVYECNGQLYVDVDPRKSKMPDICTKYNNEFYGEPDNHIAEGIEILFVPRRDTWHF